MNGELKALREFVANSVSAPTPNALAFAFLRVSLIFVFQELNPNILNVCIDSENQFASLHVACLRGDDKVVRLLIGNGAELEMKDKWGRTLLHLACFSGCIKGVGYLVECGTDLNARDDNGKR